MIKWGIPRLRPRLFAGLLIALVGIAMGCGESGGSGTVPSAYRICSAPTAQMALAGCEAPSNKPGNFGHCDFSGQNLSNQDLNCLVFTGADFAGADLSGSDLSYTVLSGTNLTGANLTNANLTGANLENANLSGANLTGATIEGANLP